MLPTIAEGISIVFTAKHFSLKVSCQVQLSGLPGYFGRKAEPPPRRAANMGVKNKKCPQCDKQIPDDEMYFVAVDEDGDFGESDEEFFCFHPDCWAQGECLGQLKAHTRWLIGLAASTLNTLRTQYPTTDVPEFAADYMPELDQAVAGLLGEANLLRTIAKEFQER
jgi:hypothetical protein